MDKVDAHLELKLDTGGARVSVAELGLALTSMSDMYEDFSIKMGASKAETAFEIQDLKKGSAILHLIGMSIGLMDQAIILKQFHEMFGTQIASWIKGVPSQLPSSEAQSQAKKMEGMARAVGESEDGELTLAYRRESEGETEVLIITKQDGQKMLENFDAARKQAKELPPPMLDYDAPQRVLMRLYQHNQDPDPSQKKRTAHKAIVRDIDSTPRPLGYLNQDVAEELREIVSIAPYATTLFDAEIELVREGMVLKAYRLVAIHGHFDDPDIPLLAS